MKELKGIAKKTEKEYATNCTETTIRSFLKGQNEMTPNKCKENCKEFRYKFPKECGKNWNGLWIIQMYLVG